jgi:hypothetical protein
MNIATVEVAVEALHLMPSLLPSTVRVIGSGKNDFTMCVRLHIEGDVLENGATYTLAGADDGLVRTMRLVLVTE